MDPSIHRRDRGFTLVEMLIAVVLTGSIVSVTAAVISATLRNTPPVATRADAARTLQGVVTWLPQDVDSTPPGGFDVNPSTASGCSSSPGVNLLRLEWAENTSGTTVRYVANYRGVDVAGNTVIKRVSCNGSGAAPLGNTLVIGASAPLPALPPGWMGNAAPVDIDITTVAGDVVLVSVAVTTVEGAMLRVLAAPKNPANTLPSSTMVGGTVPVTTVLETTTTTTTTTTAPPPPPGSTTTSTVPPPTTSTTSTTTTTTTTAPPPPPGSTTTSTVPPPTTSTTSTTTTTTLPPVCAVLSTTMSSASIHNTDPNGSGNSSTNVGVLRTPLTITVQTNGYCAGLEARASTGAPNGELFRNFSASGTTYTVSFPGHPQGSSELWRDGFRTISFHSPTGGPYGTALLLVR